ncbi:TetR/AcrR family transcriptional regulator [Virgibacillus byunsanensis]|uniref:TetR/AcrR family transcriptional regulator n=1 Tax=Virgibacillus byunsanensis TaxID=570945 RepID=A0ABW3LMV8_9BACI
MNYKEKNRRNQILRASLNALSDKGFNTVTLQDIADYAGVSKGVTNYYFKSKADVFGHLFEWLTQRIYENESAAVSSKYTAMEKLEAYVNAAFSSPEKNKQFFRVYLDFLAQANHSSNYREINNRFYENCWSIGREIASIGQREGVFPDFDIDVAGVAIRASIDGCLLQWLMRNQSELHGFYRDVCYKTILGYLMNGEISGEKEITNINSTVLPKNKI